MNTEKMNQCVIDRGLHRLELGDNIWSAMGAIVDKLGASWPDVVNDLDCSLLALADAAMDARDARDAAQDTQPR